MKRLTTETIVKDLALNEKMAYSLFSVVVGVAITLLPIIYEKGFSLNAIIGLIFCGSIFGTVFGYYFGYRLFKRFWQQKTAILSENYHLCLDTAVAKYIRSNGIRTDRADHYCQVKFASHHNVTGLYYNITRREYNKICEGDRFYLVYIGDMSNVIAFYPDNEYALDDLMKKHLV